MNKLYYIYRDTVDSIPFLSVEEFNDERYQLLDKLEDRNEAVKIMANLYRTTLIESDEYVFIAENTSKTICENCFTLI